MKDVGIARKKKGNHGRINTRQLPVFDTDNQIETVVSSKSSRNGTTLHGLATPATSSSSSSPEDTEGTDYDELVPRSDFRPKKTISGRPNRPQDVFSFAAINLFSNYETARSKFQVDLADLALLTDFNVNISTKTVLSENPSRLVTLLGHKQ